MDLTLTDGQFDLVYNSFSFVIAAMGAAFLFFLLSTTTCASSTRSRTHSRTSTASTCSGALRSTRATDMSTGC